MKLTSSTVLSGVLSILVVSCSAAGVSKSGPSTEPGSGGAATNSGTGGEDGEVGSGGAGVGGISGGTGGDTSSSGGTSSTGGADGTSCVPNPGGSLVDQMDGTLLDQKTCLMWTKDAWPNTGDGTGREHVASCSSASVAGHADWRGPDLAEMTTLIADPTGCGSWNDPSLWEPILGADALPGAPNFWTATEGDGGEHQCAVNGNNGDLLAGSRKNPYHVVCVRGTSSVTGTKTSCTGTACD